VDTIEGSINKIKELYDSGLTIKQVARSIHKRASFVTHIIDALGIKRDKAKFKLGYTPWNKIDKESIPPMEEPYEGMLVHGFQIGKASKSQKRQWFKWVICPKCGKGRWRTKYDKKKRPKSPTNTCHKCATSIKGADSTSWKGGITKDHVGYVMIKISDGNFFSPMANGKGYIREHRLIMAKHLGRCLHRWELVHHKNHIKDDNRLENLQLISDSRHNQITILEMRISYLEKLLSKHSIPFNH